jgi:molybdopterin-guanine dinucleotide biosynthesis protein A
LLSSQRLRVSLLLEACSWKELDEASLLADPCVASLDPGLESVTNLNNPQEYETARAQPQPTIQVQWLDAEGSRRPGPITLRAATLGGAAEAIGVRLSSQLVVALNGEKVRPDPEEPLVTGDVVYFGRVRA